MEPGRARGRLAAAERLLAERGRDLGGGRARVAVGRSGIAVGFPSDPLIHLSWWALAAAVVAGAAIRRRR